MLMRDLNRWNEVKRENVRCDQCHLGRTQPDTEEKKRSERRGDSRPKDQHSNYYY